MTLERLTQITSVGITSGITLNNATLTGVTTIASLDSVGVGGTITAVDGNFSGNVSIAGTLTYEDVTNIDSVGLITARSGLNVTGGSVGIGTDNPAEDVHIQAARADVLIEGTNDTVSGNVANLSLMAPYYRKVGYSIKDSAGNEDFFIGRPYGQGDSNPDLVINMTGTEKVRVKNNGNVGIGTDNPERTLSVATNNPMIQIWGTGGSGKQWSIISSDDTTGANAASRGGNFVIYDDTSGGLGDVLTLTGIGGSMGLGTQNPSSLLEIDSGGSYGIRGDVAGRVGQSKRFIGKWTSGTTHNIAVVDGGTPRGQSRLGGFVVTFTYRSMYGFDGDGGGHGVRMLSGRVRDSGEWGFDTETNSAVGDTPVPTLQGTDNSDGTCTIQLVNPSSTHSFGEFNLIVWDCDIISPST